MVIIKKFKQANSGFTLTELLMTMLIVAIISTVIVTTLQTSLEVFTYSKDESLLHTLVRDVLTETLHGTYTRYGVKDAVLITSAGPQSLSFVPIWIDTSQKTKPSTKGKKPEYILNRQFKAGSALPVAEILDSSDDLSRWKITPLTFQFGVNNTPRELDDIVALKVAHPVSQRLRFFFLPEHEHFPDVIMSFLFRDGGIYRTYKGSAEKVPPEQNSEVKISDFKLSYYDNANTLIPFNSYTGYISEAQLSQISGVQMNVTVRRMGIAKEGQSFINLRNPSVSGGGLIVREGSKLSMPNSADIEAFTISNIQGFNDNAKILLEARNDKKEAWQVELKLGYKNNVPVIKSYTIMYPPGQIVYAQDVYFTTELPFSLMNLGLEGRYDYDVDDNGQDVVNLKGKVILYVNKMEASGASIYAR